MLTVNTWAGELTVRERFHGDGFELGHDISGVRLTGGLVAIDARCDLLGRVTQLRTRHYAWSPSPHGNGGSGCSGAEVDARLATEARQLVEEVFATVVGALVLDHTATATRVREVVVVTAAPEAAREAVVALVPELSEASVTIGPGELVVALTEDAAVGAAEVATALAVAGAEAHVSERVAYRTRKRELPCGGRLDLAAPVTA